MGRKIIAGNWKMNMLPNEAMEFITKLSERIRDTQNEVILCVPYTDLFYSLLTAQGTNIKIGAQNMHWEEKGAYTGEIAPKMLKSINVEYVIIGHSERRQYFAETDETVNKKIKSAMQNNLKPIVCVGENLEQKENNKTNEIITTQTQKALEGLTNSQVESTIIAYEPIWAIGTGKTASKVKILYGGSVKPENAKELFDTSDIDGALVGGASLNVHEFEKIVNCNK